MKLHREGTKILLVAFSALAIINLIVFLLARNNPIIYQISILCCVPLFLFVVQFFRYPVRIAQVNDKQVLSPADGKIVVIEETVETEFFKDKRIQVSIFMSAWNVHINWVPVAGILKYYKYHKGLFLMAIEPKSSTDNERNTIVIETPNKMQILLRQIAGVVARRIVFYPTPGDSLKQGQEMGFIKFGSRVDIFLPLGTKINVKLNDKVIGTQTVIAEI